VCSCKSSCACQLISINENDDDDDDDDESVLSTHRYIIIQYENIVCALNVLACEKYMALTNSTYAVNLL